MRPGRTTQPSPIGPSVRWRQIWHMRRLAGSAPPEAFAAEGHGPDPRRLTVTNPRTGRCRPPPRFLRRRPRASRLPVYERPHRRGASGHLPGPCAPVTAALARVLGPPRPWDGTGFAARRSADRLGGCASSRTSQCCRGSCGRHWDRGSRRRRGGPVAWREQEGGLSGPCARFTCGEGDRLQLGRGRELLVGRGGRRRGPPVRSRLRTGSLPGRPAEAGPHRGSGSGTGSGRRQPAPPSCRRRGGRGRCGTHTGSAPEDGSRTRIRCPE